MNNNFPQRLSSLILSCRDLAHSYIVDGRPLTVAEADTIGEQLQQSGIYARIIQADGIGTEEALIDALDAAFSFPVYFGRNWNAVDECLADMSWLPATGYCCIIFPVDGLRERIPQVYEIFLDVFRVAAQKWQHDSKPFKLLIG